MRDKIHNTYNRTKAPTKNDTNRTILFNFVTYHVPLSEGNTFTTLYTQLYNAVMADDAQKNFGTLSTALKALEPYKVHVKVRPQDRQSEIYDPFDDKTLN